MKLARIAALFAAGTVLIVGGGVAALALRAPAQRPASTERVEVTPERLARGDYLVHHVCGCLDCHSTPRLDRFSMPPTPGTEGQGGLVFDASFGVPGVVAAHNITPEPETGVGAWSDGELMRAIREGIARDGRALFPMMPYHQFRAMSDEDVRSVVAYLRSLKPVRNSVAATALDFPVNLLIKLEPRPLEGPVVAPDPEREPEAYARYVTTLAGCEDCHTQRDPMQRPIAGTELAGGREFRLPTGRIVSANISPHPDSFVGQATKEQFIGRFRQHAYASPDAVPTVPAGKNTLMPWSSYAGMTDRDLGAIYDFLRAQKPQPGRVVTHPDASETP